MPDSSGSLRRATVPAEHSRKCSTPRREHGCDNRDRAVRGGLARLDGNRVAVVPLPDYPIAAIRTGQYDDTGALWAAEFPCPTGSKRGAATLAP